MLNVFRLALIRLHGWRGTRKGSGQRSAPSAHVSLLLLLGATLYSALGPAHAQSSAVTGYPNRPVRLVVGFPAGGPTDTMARLFADKLGEALGGASFIVDNRPGAGSTIASDYVARSKPDGYTFLVATLAGQGLAPSVYPKLPYDPIKDFSAVSQLASTPNLLAVHPSLPVKSVKELVTYLKAHPGKLNYANAGSGTSQHMAMELFKHLTQTEVVAVTYRGSAPAIVDLLSGQTQMMIDNTSSIGPYVKSGKLRGLAVTSSARVPAYADIPTMNEEGVAGYEIVSWFGLVAPAGTPQAIIDRVAQACSDIVRSPAYVARLAELGATPASSTPAQFSEKIRAEIAKWAPLVQAAGVKVQ